MMNVCKGGKQCRVCGGKANSFNFNGLACESCKTFFRRNAFKPTAFSCYNESKCQINTSNRKYCKKCRLDRCYEIGMKKELIWRSKYEQQNLTAALPKDKNNTEKILPLSNEVISLTSYEKKLIEEVSIATTMFPEETTLRIVGVTQNLLEALGLPKFYIKKFIQYCKCFEGFKCLSQDDQLTLLKRAYVPVLNTRFAFVYDPVTNRFPTMASEEGEIAIYTDNAVLFEWNKRDMPIRFTKFQVSLNEEMEHDPMIRNLICARFLFRHRENDLQNPEFVRYQYFAYCKLLLRYLEHKYQDVLRATKKYYSLMEMLKAMEYQQETIEELFADLGLAKEDPVHKELFDLY